MDRYDAGRVCGEELRGTKCAELRTLMGAAARQEPAPEAPLAHLALAPAAVSVGRVPPQRRTPQVHQRALA